MLVPHAQALLDRLNACQDYEAAKAAPPLPAKAEPSERRTTSAPGADRSPERRTRRESPWPRTDGIAEAPEGQVRILVTAAGIDAGNAGAAPAQVQAAVQRAERDRAHADVERLCQVTERAEARRLLREADHDERRANEVRSAADHEPGPEADQRLGAAVEAGQRETTSVKCVRPVEPCTTAEGTSTPSSGPSLRVKRTGLTW